MYKYQIVSDNPEGIDWIIQAEHDRKFTAEEFAEIVEDAIVYALEKEYTEQGLAFKTGVYTEYIINFLKDNNFVFNKEDIEQIYYYNPFSDNISKTSKLYQWCNRDKGEDKPLYMQRVPGIHLANDAGYLAE